MIGIPIAAPEAQSTREDRIGPGEGHRTANVGAGEADISKQCLQRDGRALAITHRVSSSTTLPPSRRVSLRTRTD